MAYIVIATNRPGTFVLQKGVPEFPPGGLLRRSARRCNSFETYERAWCAIDRSNLFTRRHPEHWFTREWRGFTVKIIKLDSKRGGL